MKGVKNKLSFTLGKKPRETKKNSTDIKLQPLTGLSKSRIYTGPNGRSDASTPRKDTSIPRPNGSKILGNKSSTLSAQESAAYQPQTPEVKTPKTLQTDDSILYRDDVEDKIIKELKDTKRSQYLPHSKIDFDHLIDHGNVVGDEVKDNVDILIDKYAPGFPKGGEDFKTSSKNENDVHQTHETTRAETSERIKEQCDDDIAAGKGYCVFVDKQDDLQSEEDANLTKEPESPATQSNDSLEIDEDVPLVKQAIRLLHPKHDSLSSADPQFDKTGSPEEDKLPRATTNQTAPQYDYPQNYASGEHLEEEKRENSKELHKDIYGLDTYNNGLFNYGLNKDPSSINVQHGRSTSPYNQCPEGNNYTTFNPDLGSNACHNDQVMRNYPYELPSDHNIKREKMYILEEYEEDPDSENFYERDDFIIPGSKDEGRQFFTGPNISNYFQTPVTDLDTNIDSRPDGYTFKDDAEQLPVQLDTQVSNGHKLNDDAGYMTLSFDESSGRRLSLFGRWMVTHGQLVDPQNFCLWSYASCPDHYMDLSKYQMDMQGRWMDRNGLYITPFFYCHGYDGEPLYLGDCDCYDVFSNSFDIGAEDANDFANNPERYIDLSNFQMDMKERWMDSCGRYTDLADWYHIESEEEEYPEYSWLYNRCKSPDLFYLPEGMDDYGQDFSQENVSYLPKTEDLVANNPYPMDFTFAEEYAFWEYPERYEDPTEEPTSLPNSWMSSRDFCDNFHGVNEDVFSDEDETDSYPYKQYLAMDKTK